MGEAKTKEAASWASHQLLVSSSAARGAGSCRIRVFESACLVPVLFLLAWVRLRNASPSPQKRDGPLSLATFPSIALTVYFCAIGNQPSILGSAVNNLTAETIHHHKPPGSR
jgi:hypothetical protein